MRRHHSPAKSISSAICLLTGLISLLLSSCGSPLAAESTRTGRLEDTGLHGKVQSCTIYDLTQLERFGKYIVFEDFSYPVSSYSFSENGGKTETTYYDTVGIPVMNEKLVADADGKQTWTKYGYGDSGTSEIEVGGYTTYFGNDTTIDFIRGYYLDGTQGRVNWVHTYDYVEPGRKTVISSYAVNVVTSTLQWKHIQNYRDNRLVAVEHRDSDGNVEWTDRFGYDAKGNKTEWSHFLPNGHLNWIERSKYDKAGNEIERARFDSAGHEVSKQVFRYVNLPAVKIQDFLDNGESLFASKGYDPNRAGDMVESFDQAGNWTVKVTLEENRRFGYKYLEITEVQKREIQYYE